MKSPAGEKNVDTVVHGGQIVTASNVYEGSVAIRCR